MRSEAELEAHSSAGLIRRAKKALNSSQPVITLQNADAIEYEFEGFIGRVDRQRFAQSHCDCPASGMCKHLVAVMLYHMANADVQTNLAYTPPDFTAAQLSNIRNKSAWRKAYTQVNRLLLSDDFSVVNGTDHCAVSWEHHKAIIGSSNDVENIVVEGQHDVTEKLIAALLLQQFKGEEIDWPGWVIEEIESAEERRIQEQQALKLQVRSCLMKLTDIGISQLRSANLHELNSLAPRLKSFGLSGMGNALNALNERVTLQETGVGLDHDQAILFLLGQIFANCESRVENMQQAKACVENNKLMCLGGHQWQTDSKVHGLSMVFVSAQGELFSASLARPIKTPGFSPVQAWWAQQLWDSAPLNQNMPGNCFELDTIELNQWGNLVLKSDATFRPLEPDAFSMLTTKTWDSLRTTEEYGYALLEPTRWLSCEFHEKLQELQLVVEDEEGRVLLIRQAFRGELELRIANFSELWVDSPKYLVVRHRMQSGEHIFEPILAFTDKWISPDFTQLNQKKTGLLQRLALKWKKKGAEPPQRQLRGLALQLHKLREQMCVYPCTDADGLNEICVALEQLGLDLVSTKIKAMKRRPDIFLELSYLIAQLARHNAKWPIFETRSDFHARY